MAMLNSQRVDVLVDVLRWTTDFIGVTLMEQSLGKK